MFALNRFENDRLFQELPLEILYTAFDINVQEILTRICEMVISFESDANFFWVELLINNVIDWDGLKRLETTSNFPFQNLQIKRIINELK